MAKKNTKQSRKKTNGKPKMPARVLSGKQLDYARLLNDPCTGPLTNPEYGSSESGYLARFRRSLTVSVGANTSGYVVWFPDFVGQTGGSVDTEHNGSLFLFVRPSGDESPTNTAALPLGAGSGAAQENGKFEQDPAFQWVNGTAVQDARTVSACIQFSYLGPMNTTQGRFGFVEGFTRENLIDSAGGAPVTADELMGSATKVMRMPLETQEIKHRPSAQGQYFRTAARDVTNNAASDSADACFHTGRIGVSPTSVHNTGSTSGAVSGIGFTWTGMAAQTSFCLDFVKAIEWRPETGNGIVLTVPRNVGGENRAQKVVALLDQHVPGWQHTAKTAVSAGLTKAAQYILGGSLPGDAMSVGMSGLKMLTN